MSNFYLEGDKEKLQPVADQMGLQLMHEDGRKAPATFP